MALKESTVTLRTIATPLTIGSFVVVCLTGLFLFFGVRGLTGPVHEWTSLVFVVGSIFHIIINWKATLAHLKKPLGASLAIICVVLSVVAILPWGGKQQNPKQVLRQSMEVLLDTDLKGVAAVTRQSEQVLEDKLIQAGFKTVDAKATLREIAKANGKSTMATMSAILPAKAEGHH